MLLFPRYVVAIHTLILNSVAIFPFTVAQLLSRTHREVNRLVSAVRPG